MNDLGLKEFLINSKKEKIKLGYFIKRLRWELRYAWRRAWIGYDDIDMFDCFERFRVRMIKILEDFIKYGHGLLSLPKEIECYDELLKKYPEGFFDEETTNLIYQTMIFHLRMMDEDYVEKVLYGSNIYDDDYQFGCRTIEERRIIGSVMLQNKNLFMKLFSLFYYDLWD